MNQDKELINSYFKEVKKYPPLAKEEERDLCGKLLIEIESFKRDLLSIPLAWKMIALRYMEAKPSKRAVKKLFEKPTFSYEEIGDILTLVHKTPLKHLLVSPYQVRDLTDGLARMDIAQEVLFDLLDNLQGYLSKPGRLKETVGIYKKDFKQVMQAAKESKTRLIDLRNKFLCANLRLVVSFALQYQHLGVPLEDLIQEGNAALVRAIEKFNPRLNLKFSTYATWWIKQSFIKLFRNQGRTVRLPAHIHELSARVLKFVKDYDGRYNRNPSISEISVALDVPEEIIENLNDLYADHVSMEAEISTGKSNSQVKSLKDFLVADTPNPVDEIQDAEVARELHCCLLTLNPDERKVIQLRYGLDSGCFYTLDKISYYCKSSRERVKKLEKNALQSLKEKMTKVRDEL